MERLSMAWDGLVRHREVVRPLDIFEFWQSILNKFLSVGIENFQTQALDVVISPE